MEHLEEAQQHLDALNNLLPFLDEYQLCLAKKSDIKEAIRKEKREEEARRKSKIAQLKRQICSVGMKREGQLRALEEEVSSIVKEIAKLEKEGEA